MLPYTIARSLWRLENKPWHIHWLPDLCAFDSWVLVAVRGKSCTLSVQKGKPAHQPRAAIELIG